MHPRVHSTSRRGNRRDLPFSQSIRIHKLSSITRRHKEWGYRAQTVGFEVHLRRISSRGGTKINHRVLLLKIGWGEPVSVHGQSSVSSTNCHSSGAVEAHGLGEPSWRKAC